MSMLQMTKQHLEEELDRSSLALVSPFDHAHSMTSAHKALTIYRQSSANIELL
ncbi:hypothetical protein KY289_030722 [Solanum tuberosum]|nr:hypothetical protein KY289_030722 [Solanum tuberosum]